MEKTAKALCHSVSWRYVPTAYCTPEEPHRQLY